MQLVVHPDAQDEILEAADWYDQHASGLADDLLAEVDHALDRILEQPAVWPPWPGTTANPQIQRFLLSRFHFYAVAYQQFGDQIVVLAFVHARRRPFYWLKRRPGVTGAG